MNAYFDDDGALVIEAVNNTEMVALDSWAVNYNPTTKKGDSVILIRPKEHLISHLSKQARTED